jgi:hypothetical protein
MPMFAGCCLLVFADCCTLVFADCSMLMLVICRILVFADYCMLMLAIRRMPVFTGCSFSVPLSTVYGIDHGKIQFIQGLVVPGVRQDPGHLEFFKVEYVVNARHHHLLYRAFAFADACSLA